MHHDSCHGSEGKTDPEVNLVFWSYLVVRDGHVLLRLGVEDCRAGQGLSLSHRPAAQWLLVRHLGQDKQFKVHFRKSPPQTLGKESTRSPSLKPKQTSGSPAEQQI